MKIKVSEATRVQLDWLVAKTQGESQVLVCRAPLRILYIPKGKRTWYVHSPTTNWKQGGPIIERENIAVLPPVVRRISEDRHAFTVNYFRAMIQQDEDKIAIHGRGPTPLIAAMRCYVASIMGDEIEIPEELQ